MIDKLIIDKVKFPVQCSHTIGVLVGHYNYENGTLARNIMDIIAREKPDILFTVNIFEERVYICWSLGPMIIYLTDIKDCCEISLRISELVNSYTLSYES